MDNHANIIDNFRNLVKDNNKLMQSFYNRENLIDCLENEIGIGKYPELIENIQWIYDDYNQFNTFEEYKEFTEQHNPELIESLENIENYIHRLEDVINYLEDITKNGIEEISNQLKIITFSRIQEVKNEIKKYNSPIECKTINNGLYQVLNNYKKKLGEEWYNETTEHWERSREWTKELVEEEIKNYNSPKECEKNDVGLYQALNKYRKRLGDYWYNEITSHWKRQRDWTKELVEDEVQNYNSPKECYQGDSGLYTTLNNYKETLGDDWYNKITSHWERERISRKWTKELVEDEVQNYNSPKECEKNDSKLYNILNQYRKKVGDEWYNNVTSHWERNREWTKELVEEEIKNYNSPKECSKIDGGLYTTLNQYRKKLGDDWYNKITSHWKRKKRNWTPELIEKEVKKYNSLKECAKSDGGLYTTLNNYKETLGDDWYNKITSHWKRRRKLTQEKIKLEIEKYSTPKECQKNDISVYQALNKYRKILGDEWYNNVTSHWERELREWTPESIGKEALKYNSPYECKKSDGGLYKTINQYKRTLGEKWYNNVTSHWISNFEEREKEYKDNIFEPRLIEILEKHKLKYNLNKEEIIPKRDNDDGRIDYVLNIIDFNLLIPIEIKHDDSIWTEDSIDKQIKKYNRAYRERKGMTGTYLVSPEGKYGFSEKEFLNIIEELIEKEELALPNSLDWHKKRRD